MKKIILFSLLIVCAQAMLAQDAGLPPRPYTKAELQRWSFICQGLSTAIPTSFKDYTFRQTSCGEFDWAETDRNRSPLTVINKKNEPIGNHPNFSAWYQMNEDSVSLKSQLLDVDLLKTQKEDGSFDMKQFNIIGAKSEKLRQCSTLSIEILTNVVIDLAKQYEITTKPEKLNLPVDAFAFLYRFPEGKEVKEEGSSIGTDGLAFYKDKALIILSIKPTKVVTSPPCDCTWKEDKVYPQDNAPDVSTAPLKNIVISIDGYEKDIREIITQINWKALATMIGK
ncbi:MAG: hypothetical protein WDN26_00860 [Chitinophagaceae bacterium]